LIQTSLTERFDFLEDIANWRVLARDKKSGSTVTLKVFLDFKPYEEEARAALRDVLAAGSLSCPHIERVLEIGRIGDDVFIAAEALDAVLLDATLGTRAWSATDIHGVIRQIAEALSVAHRAGILHGELTPSTVMVLRSEDGTPKLKVLDFGMAALETAFRFRGGRTPMWMPNIDHLVYSSPEAIGARARDPRDDLYSLGVIAFALVAGSRPFVATDTTLLLSILKQPAPRLTHADPRFPRMKEIDLFLQRALAKNRADRPPDAATFLCEFEAALFG
jgi:serine/threonine-protein kinase